MSIKVQVTILIFCAFLSRAETSQAAVGQVLSVRGQPILTPKINALNQALGPGKSVDAGDLVSTDQKSTAKIHLIDETILDVNILSKLIIPRILDPLSRERMVFIEVQRGKVRAKVNRELERSKGRFEIHTHAAYLGVEGTDFVVEVQPPDQQGRTSTTITVIEGQVTVRSEEDPNNPSARRVTLGPGMRFTATARVIGEAVQRDLFRTQDIQRLRDSALNEAVRRAKLDNETFLQSVSLSSGPGGFGFSTLHTLSQNVKSDQIDPLNGNAENNALFRKRFRDDEFSTHSNLVDITIGFPQ